MMRIFHAFLFLIILSTGFPAEGVAQDQSNAWDNWQEIIPYFSSHEGEDGLNDPILSSDQLYLLEAYMEGPLTAPSPEVLAVLEQAQPALDLMRESASAEQFDPGLDYSEGFFMLMPHLSVMRGGTRLLMAQARASAAMGDLDAMTDMLGIASGISTHAGEDGTIISSLVSTACYMLLDQNLGSYMGSGMVDQDQAGILLEQMANLQVDDPMNYGNAVAGEQDMMMLFMDDLIEGSDEERSKMLKELQLAVGFPHELDVDRLREEKAMAAELFAQMTQGFKDPDRKRGQALIEDAHQQIEELAESGEWLFAKLMPSILLIMDRQALVEDLIADRLRQLDGLATGRLDPNDLMNAGPIWLHAGKTAAELAPELQASAIALIGLADQWQLPLPATGRRADLPDPRPEPLTLEEARRIWSQARGEIEPLTIAGLDAATIDSADFSVNKENRPFIDRAYLGHLRAISRTLLADAMLRLLEWTDSEADGTTPQQRELADINVLLGAEELSAVIMLLKHLQDDPLIAHAMLGTAIFRETSLVSSAYIREIARRDEAGKATPEIDRAVLSTLRSAIDDVPRADPFSRDTALAAEKKNLTESRWSWSLRDVGVDINEISQQIEKLNINQVASMLACLDAQGPVELIDIEADDGNDVHVSTYVQNTIPNLKASPPIGAMARVDDYLPLSPPWTGDGPRRMAMVRRVVKAAKADSGRFGEAFDALNLKPVVPVQEMIINAYSLIGDTDEVLRMRP